MDKKIFLSIGAIGSIVAPIASIIACGNNEKHSTINWTNIIDPINDIKAEISKIEYPKHYKDVSEQSTFNQLKSEAQSSNDIKRLKEIKNELSGIIQMDNSEWKVYHEQIVNFIKNLDTDVFSEQDKQGYLNTLESLSNEDKDGVQIYKDVQEWVEKIGSRAKIKDFAFIKKTSGYYVEYVKNSWNHPDHKGFWIPDFNKESIDKGGAMVKAIDSEKRFLFTWHHNTTEIWNTLTRVTHNQTFWAVKNLSCYEKFWKTNLNSTNKTKIFSYFNYQNKQRYVYWLQKVDEKHPIYTYQTHWHGFYTWATNTLDNITGNSPVILTRQFINNVANLDISKNDDEIKTDINTQLKSISSLLNITLEHTRDNKLKVTYTPKPLTDDYYGFKTKVDGLDPITKIYE